MGGFFPTRGPNTCTFWKRNCCTQFQRYDICSSIPSVKVLRIICRRSVVGTDSKYSNIQITPCVYRSITRGRKQWILCNGHHKKWSRSLTRGFKYWALTWNTLVYFCVWEVVALGGLTVYMEASAGKSQQIEYCYRISKGVIIGAETEYLTKNTLISSNLTESVVRHAGVEFLSLYQQQALNFMNRSRKSTTKPIKWF